MSALAAASISAIGAASAQAALPNLTISATSTAITITGTPTAGGVNILAGAAGVKEAAIILVKVRAGVTAEEVLAVAKAKKGDPNQIAGLGSIVFDQEAPAKGDSETQTTLEPGSYIALVAGEKGPTGAHTTFTVAASPVNPPLPAAAAKIRTIDFGFKGPSTIKAGSLVGFENEGFVVHMDFAFPVKSHKAATKAIGLLRLGRERGLNKLIAGPPVSFAGPLSSGAYQQEVITARPGWYVQVCFMETQDGRPHTLLGMERVLHIVK